MKILQLLLSTILGKFICGIAELSPKENTLEQGRYKHTKGCPAGGTPLELVAEEAS